VEELYMSRTVTWIIVALVVLALVVLAAVLLTRARRSRSVDRRREEAHELRQRAEADRIELQRREAEAARIDAEARAAQAEADARAADAAQLQAEARERAEHTSGSRAEVEERLRRAEEIDPDVTPDGRGAVGRDDRAADDVQDDRNGTSGASTRDVRGDRP
jgi:hypothetical protein